MFKAIVIIFTFFFFFLKIALEFQINKKLKNLKNVLYCVHRAGAGAILKQNTLLLRQLQELQVIGSTL
jgi:hypothetical protein